MSDRRDRRWFLQRAGIAGAGGIGLGVLGSAELSQALRPTPVTAIDVRTHGARGDGRADDRDAIQSALDGAAEDGGAVFLPPGDYAVGGSLAPRSSTLVFGTHVPRYDERAAPASACRIRMRDGFDGEGLIVPAPDARGVALRDVALVGDGVGTGLHGIRMPAAADVPGAQGWSLEHVSIAGFSGNGIEGRVFVWTVTDCHVHNNGGWGISATGGDSWTDAYLQGTMVFFNRRGGVRFGGPQPSGLVHFVNCRFERSGGQASDPGAPLDPAAPGVRIEAATRLLFANCSTDANMGHGVVLEAARGGRDSGLANVHFVNCALSRDGTGDQRRQGEFAGLKAARGANDVKLANCMVTAGLAADDGSGSIRGPKYGVWLEETIDFQWVGGFTDAVARRFHTGRGGNVRPFVLSPGDGLTTLPLAAPAEAFEGAAYVDAESGRLMVRAGGRWRSVTFD